MSSSNYHQEEEKSAGSEYYYQSTSANVRVPEDHNELYEDNTAVQYMTFSEPHVPLHYDSNMGQEAESSTSNPYGYASEKEESDAFEILNTEEEKIKEHVEAKEENNEEIVKEVKETTEEEIHLKAMKETKVEESDEEENKKEEGNEQPRKLSKRDTLIGEEEVKEEKENVNKEQLAAQKIEYERKLKAKMEEEKEKSVFVPEVDPQPVYIASPAKPRTEEAESEGCCWGCLAWLCCWNSGKK